MPLDLEVIAKILSPLLAAIISFIVKSYFENKPKLISYLVHASAIPLNDGKNTTINTHSVVVKNIGRSPAHNIRIGHLYLPPSFQIFPPVHYNILSSPNESKEILIPVLVPNEQISISYLYFPPLTFGQINSYTKSDEGFAKIINAIPKPEPAKFIIFIFWTLRFIGVWTVAYWTILHIAHMLMPSA